MKKMLKIPALLLVMGLVLGLAGCPAGDDDDSKGKEEPNKPVVSGIDYTNNLTNFSIQVKNDSQKNLVAFKGPPSSSSLISGIPKTSGVHGLKKDTALFSSTGDFVLWLITEEDYLANKNNLPSLENRPFTRIYAYYNQNSVNNIVYTISTIIGGNKRIVLQNRTSYNVELRNNGPQGLIIGYTGSQTYNTTFNVEPGLYMVFPVFRKYNTALGEIISAFPEYGPGSPLAGTAKFIEFSLDNADSEATIDAASFVQGIKITAGASFLIVQNNNSTGVGLWDGLVRQTTESGGQAINPNRSLLFPIYMNRTDDNKYAAFETKAQFKIGTSAYQLTVPSFNYENGKIYKIIVSGNGADDIQLGTVTFERDWEF